MFTLFPDQKCAFNDTLTALEQHNSILVVAATGFGKTVLAISLINQFIQQKKRVLVLVHGRELIGQWSKQLDKGGLAYNDQHGVFMAGAEVPEIMNAYLLGMPCMVASKDTLRARRSSGALMAYPKFDVVIADEAHLSAASSWYKIIKHYQRLQAKIIGLTATPMRNTTGLGLGNVFEVIVPTTPTHELIGMGRLVPPIYWGVSEFDRSMLEVRNGEFVLTTAGEVLVKPKYLGSVTDQWFKLARGRRTIIFCCGVKHSKAVTREFTGRGIVCAHMDGKMDTETRKETMDAFRCGEIQILTNSDLFCHGLDVPEVECIVILRPTKSKIRWIQMVGRGLRVAEGKTDCLILDQAGNANALGLAETPQEWSLEKGVLPEKPHPNPQVLEAIKTITCAKCDFIYEPQKECPNCGYRYEAKAYGVEWLDGELVKIKLPEKYKPRPHQSFSQIDKQQFYQRLVGANEEHATSSAARNRTHYMYMGKFKEKSPWEWRDLPALEPTIEEKNYVIYHNLKRAKSR